MSIEIREGDARAFFEAPFSAYPADLPYVSPLRGDLLRILDARANPFFTDGAGALAAFTAHRDGRVLGRITAHVHGASNRLHGSACGYFGFFDVAEEESAARALLSAAEGWLRRRGMGEILGNMNLTAMQQMGVLTEGFARAPFTDQIWSPPWLPGFLERAGYRREFGMTTHVLDIAAGPPLPEAEALLARLGLSFVPITRRNVAARMEEARAILNASFAANPMFVPLTAAEFAFQARDLKWILDPRISMMAHLDGRPAACILCIPDLNPLLARIRSRPGLAAPWHYLRHRMTNTRAVLIFAGVLPELQGQGVNPALMARLFRALADAGYRTLGNTWIGDVNGPSLRQAEKAGARPLHRLHLFRKAL